MPFDLIVLATLLDNLP